MNPAQVGRPRDPRVDEALTTHLVDLLTERGPDGFSVDELADRCGVGKAAIYRRYRSREELVAAGFEAANQSMPDVSDLPVREALVRLLEWVSGAHAAGMTPTWLVAMQQMPALREKYMTQVVEPRRDALRAVVARGQRDGHLRVDIPTDVIVTTLSAPAVLVGMHRARGYPRGEVGIEDVVDLILTGLLSPEARATGS
ncbi:MAG: TetR/AcrR family transcriptional regulator [Candidatus Nanopelagicales bacterium]